MVTEKIRLIMNTEFDCLTEPYSVDDLRERMDKDGKVTGIIKVPLKDIIHANIEEFIDLISEKLTDTVLLSGVCYDVIGCDSDSNLYIEVTGELEMSDDLLEEEEDADATSVKVYCDSESCPHRINGICTNDAISIDYEGVCTDHYNY